MNSLHEQVAALQQKTDYLIDQMAALTGASQQAPASALRSPLGRKPAGAPETNRPAGPKNEIGLNRYRAMQAKG
ncbi:MAG: hypothetical protein H7Z72_06365 [Bacteroidetes bacterium]|nr:hypothetical protein [Fibrella sp.]